MKKIFFTTILFAASNTLTAAEVNLNLKQKLMEQGLSDNCSKCLVNKLENTTQPSLIACQFYKPINAPPYVEIADINGCIGAKKKYVVYFDDLLRQIPYNCAKDCKPQSSAKKR